jgi:hypothetical protein
MKQPLIFLATLLLVPPASLQAAEASQRKTDRWSYHEWRDFKSGHVVGQELYDKQVDPLETVNLASTVDAAAQIPAIAAQLKTMSKKGKP